MVLVTEPNSNEVLAEGVRNSGSTVRSIHGWGVRHLGVGLPSQNSSLYSRTVLMPHNLPPGSHSSDKGTLFPDGKQIVFVEVGI